MWNPQDTPFEQDKLRIAVEKLLSLGDMRGGCKENEVIIDEMHPTTGAWSNDLEAEDIEFEEVD